MGTPSRKGREIEHNGPRLVPTDKYQLIVIGYNPDHKKAAVFSAEFNPREGRYEELKVVAEYDFSDTDYEMKDILDTGIAMVRTQGLIKEAKKDE